MKHFVMAALLAYTASNAFATGNHQEPKPTPPSQPTPIVVPISGTSSSSADAAAQAAALAAANATAIQKQQQKQHTDVEVRVGPVKGGDSTANSQSRSEGGAANATANGAGNVTTLSETTTYEASKFPPQLPAVFLTMSAPCMGSAGGGAGQGVTVINLAFTYSDSECKEIRRVTTLAGALWGMNMRYSAFTVLCTFPKFRENIPTCSQPFPLDDHKQLWGYNPIVVVDHGAEKARAERAEAELARLKQPTTPLLTGITKADLDELKASLVSKSVIRVEAPTDKVVMLDKECKQKVYIDKVTKEEVTMCPGAKGKYKIPKVTRDVTVVTDTRETSVDAKIEPKK